MQSQRPRLSREEYEALTIVGGRPNGRGYQMMNVNLLAPSGATLDNGQQSEPNYSVGFMIPADDKMLFDGENKSIMLICMNLAKQAFPEAFMNAVRLAQANGAVNVFTVSQALRQVGVSLPYMSEAEVNAKRVAEQKQPYDFLGGRFVLKTSTAKGKDGKPPKQPVLGSVETGKPIIFNPSELMLQGAKFYMGAEVMFQVQFQAWPMATGAKYVKAYPQQIFVTGHGERIGGPSTEAFNQFMGKTTAVNPLDAGQAIPSWVTA